MMQTIFIVAQYAISLFLAIALIFGPFALYRLTRHWSDTWRAAFILWLIAISSVLNIALVPRNLFLEATNQFDAAINSFQGAASGLADWQSRAFTLGLVGFALALLLAYWLPGKKVEHDYSARPLAIVLVLYYLLNTMTGATVAGVTGFSYKSLYFPIVLGALISLRNVDFWRMASHVKLILAVLMLTNLVAAVAFPHFALLRPYTDRLPGIDFRLYGVTSHPNALGPIAFLLLLLELYSPSRSPLHWPVLGLALANFLLAQSMTAWLTAFAVMVIAYLPYRFMAFQTRADGHASALKMSLILVVGLIGLIFALVNGGVDRLFSEDVLTLTGRTAIWTDTLAEFKLYPVFGYGPDLWGVEYRIRAGKLFAGQAHNQFIQTLGESGLVGFTLLLMYLGVLLNMALHSFRTSRGLSLALYTIIIVQCITEAPLRGVLNDWPFFIHATLLIVLVSYSRHATNGQTRPELRDTSQPHNALVSSRVHRQ